MESSIPNLLKQRAFLTPNREAIVFNGESYSFLELYLQAKELAGKIASLHVGQEDTVGILLKNRPHTFFIIHALQQLRARAVFLNHRLTPSEMEFQLKDSGAKLLIAESDFNAVTDEIKVMHPSLEAVSVEDVFTQKEKLIPQHEEYGLQDVCSIMYTSGTTGKPKGVLQTYGNHWWSATGSALNLGIRGDDSWLCAVPLFHISGFSILMRSVIYGNTVYLIEQFHEENINELLVTGKVTIMSVVSAMLYRMLDVLKERRYHNRFRCMLLGGGPAPRPLLETCVEKGIPVFQSYGMTETSSQIVTLSPEDSLRKLGSAGKPLFPSQLKIKADGEEAEVHTPGEIIVKGPNVTIGYLNREDANKENFNNGWFSTGDIGYVDEEGFLYVMDRRSDLIISGGENIYPAEVEEVLLSHPDILEAGVTGAKDPVWEQVPYGFIVTKASLSEEDIIEFCQKHLAKYKIPKRIFSVSALPRNASNKLLRRKLMDLLSEGGLE
ncbi:o-succinylbenzoate--CoA ligase [Heyndrickxia acidicola]|uniref:2-succinylbenzoate--CoA ligase n=1 Tax=Heyndrickxia acidicola TaxID=209389 RepID=A0ABU6MN04_9BACI|nr:o-succinylbenzoate--CoA ligase [Heyndrickxia acidicola]MED1206063.1 o-succinylbenzoate--CoA ligase [Heyndrickxia acidicola]